MNTHNFTYIASCVFTREEPELSVKIQDYLQQRLDMQIIRCCVRSYRVEEFTAEMPDWLQQRWRDTPHYQEFSSDATMVYVCHNCAAIFQETRPEIRQLSLWELILSDQEFVFPDYAHEKMTLQDCWRAHDNRAEQDAVRALMRKMNIDIVEQDENFDKTQFCGISLYEPSPARNLKLAPRRFVEHASGKFIPHTKEAQIDLMQKHGQKITTEKVVAYCHYCVKGLKLGRKQARHIANLLFNGPV